MQTIRIFIIISTTLCNKTQTQHYINFFFFEHVSLTAFAFFIQKEYSYKFLSCLPEQEEKVET